MPLSADLDFRVIENANIINKILNAHGFWGIENKHTGVTLSDEIIITYREKRYKSREINRFVEGIRAIYDQIKLSFQHQYYNELEHLLLLETLAFASAYHNTKQEFLYKTLFTVNTSAKFRYFSHTVLLGNINLVAMVHKQLYIHFYNYYRQTLNGDSEKFIVKCGELFKNKNTASRRFHLVDNGMELRDAGVSREFLRKFDLVDDLKGNAFDVFQHLNDTAVGFNSGIFSRKRLGFLRRALQASSLKIAKQGNDFRVQGGTVSQDWRRSYLSAIKRFDDISLNPVSDRLVREALTNPEDFYFKDIREHGGVNFNNAVRTYLDSLQLVVHTSEQSLVGHQLGY